MSSGRISVIFSLLALLAGGVAAIALYVFLGPNGENLGIAGIADVTHLLIFPITSALTAGIMARSLIGNSLVKLTRASGFMRGAATGAVAFVVSVLVHAAVLFLRLDAEAALWLALSALLFGGVGVRFASRITQRSGRRASRKETVNARIYNYFRDYDPAIGGTTNQT